jgi:TRAP-type mannitol/chloroaromatic compound transport system permease large subunit
MKGAVPIGVTMMDIYKGITPFVPVQLLALVMCIIFPEFVLYMPRRFGFIK